MHAGTPRGAGKRKRPRRRWPPEVLTDAEVLALLAACGGWLTGVRGRAEASASCHATP